MDKLAMGGLTYSAIDAGTAGFTAPRVLATVIVTVAGLAGSVAAQARGRHPMMPLKLFPTPDHGDRVRDRFRVHGRLLRIAVRVQPLPETAALLVGVGHGLVFLPMMLIGAALTSFSAQASEKIGRKALVVTGLALMTIGLAVLGALPHTTPPLLLAVLMMVVGLGEPSISPPGTALLLDVVPARAHRHRVQGVQHQPTGR